MPLADFSFVHSLRVRWAETDPVGVVFNGHYASYIHVAFTEYLRALAIPNAMVQNEAGYVLYVRKSTIDYLGAARFDDVLEIGFRCVAIGRSSLRFVQEIYCQERHLISGELVYVYTSSELGRSVALPDEWRAAILAYEKIPPVSGTA